MKTDHQTYHDLQLAMRDMIRAGMFNTLAFEDAWRMSENIKSKYKGFPPPDPDYDYDASERELVEKGVEAGLR